MQFNFPALMLEMPTKAVVIKYYYVPHVCDGQVIEFHLEPRWRQKFILKIGMDIGVKKYYKAMLSEAQNHRCCWCGIRMTDDVDFN